MSAYQLGEYYVVETSTGEYQLGEYYIVETQDEEQPAERRIFIVS